jgi:two-component system CheB/CheR fusion protein
LEIHVKAHSENQNIVILFSDNGQGIDLVKNNPQILFQPFTRFSNDTDGKGLGLYIIKTMVERNGGRVEIESTLNQGTTFRFVLQPYTLE